MLRRQHPVTGISTTSIGRATEARQIFPGRRVIGIDFKRALDLLEGFVPLPGFSQRAAKVAVGDRGVWHQFDRLPEMSGRLSETATCKQQHAKLLVGCAEIGIED